MIASKSIASKSAVLLSFALALAACSSTTSTAGGDAGSSGSSGDSGTSGSSGDSGAVSGSECPALRDKQAAANCPQFDPVKYLADCQDTERQLGACKAQFDAYATCVLGQPIHCTASGTIDDTPPPACSTQNDALSACFNDAGK